MNARGPISCLITIIMRLNTTSAYTISYIITTVIKFEIHAGDAARRNDVIIFYRSFVANVCIFSVFIKLFPLFI